MSSRRGYPLSPHRGFRSVLTFVLGGDDYVGPFEMTKLLLWGAWEHREPADVSRATVGHSVK